MDLQAANPAIGGLLLEHLDPCYCYLLFVIICMTIKARNVPSGVKRKRKRKERIHVSLNSSQGMLHLSALYLPLEGLN